MSANTAYPVELEAPDISPYRRGNVGIDYVHSFDSALPENVAAMPSTACFFQAAIIVWWMPCFADNSASVSSPRIASSATFALKSAVYRLRVTLPIQSRPSHRREQLNRLSGFQGPPLTMIGTTAMRDSSTLAGLALLLLANKEEFKKNARAHAERHRTFIPGSDDHRRY